MSLLIHCPRFRNILFVCASLSASISAAKGRNAVTSLPDIEVNALPDSGAKPDSLNTINPALAPKGPNEKPRAQEQKQEQKPEQKQDLKKPEQSDKKVDLTALAAAKKDSGDVVEGPTGIRVRYYQQVDGHYVFDDTAHQIPNSILLRRVRPVLQGTVGSIYNFRFMMDFSSSPSVLDAFGEIVFSPEARLRIGKSKTPFGLERLKASTDMDLIEFGHPTSLTPDYDLGISIHGDIRGEVLSYSIGLYSGAGDGSSGDEELDDDKDLAGRVYLFPFKYSKEESLRDFGFGLAAGFGRKRGDLFDPRVPVFRTEGQQVFFRYNNDSTKSGPQSASAMGAVVASGRGYRINPQGYWYVSSVGMFGEFVISTQPLGLAGNDNLSAAREFSNRAWNLTLSYVVTGETPSFHGLKPFRPFSMREEGAYGALELVLRASQIQFDKNLFPGFADPDVSANKAFTWTGGLNWHLSRTVKCSASLAWTKFKGGAPLGLDRSQERVFFSRVQTSF